MAKVEYDYIEGFQYHDFIEKVNKALADGWQLHGGIGAATCDNGRVWTFQALVREKGVQDNG